MSKELSELKPEYSALKKLVGKINKDPTACSLEMREKKKRKLWLKERIAMLEKQADDEVPPSGAPAAPPTILSAHLMSLPMGAAA